MNNLIKSCISDSAAEAADLHILQNQIREFRIEEFREIWTISPIETGSLVNSRKMNLQHSPEAIVR